MIPNFATGMLKRVERSFPLKRTSITPSCDHTDAVGNRRTSGRPTSLSASYTHYSLLRTAEDILGQSCLANACSATPMRSGFNL